MSLFLAFMAFNLIVFIHELGHFLFAKKFNIKVLEFSMFLGPKLFSWQRGETTYSIRCIPIMAYVKMEGEDEASESERSFGKQPLHARALTIFGGPFANLLLAAVLLTVYFAITGYAVDRISKIDTGSAAEAAGLKTGDVITKFNGKSVFQPTDFQQFLYVSKGARAKLEVMRNGTTEIVELTPKTIPGGTSYKLGVGFGSETGENATVIRSVTEGYPAKIAGILPGDKVVKIRGTPVSNVNEVKKILDASAGKEITVTMARNGQEMSMNLTPKAEKVQESYETGFYFDYERGSIPGGFKQSLGFTWSIIRSVGYSLVWLFTGQVAVNQMMGPIGMVSTIGDVVQQAPTFVDKLLYLAQVTGFLSIAVGATNLIPFPALDGSKLLLLGIEAIRRKPIPIEKEAMITMIGFAVLILFAIYAAYNDIVRLVTR